MNAMRMVGDLALSTVRLWWRCLVPLLVCLLAGYLAFEALFSASWRLGARDERIGLPVLAVAQLCELAAWVAMFLVAGRRLRLPPADGGPGTERVLGTVLLTLTPFLAFYALWGLLEPLIADHTYLAVSYEEARRGHPDAGRCRRLEAVPAGRGRRLVAQVRAGAGSGGTAAYCSPPCWPCWRRSGCSSPSGR